MEAYKNKWYSECLLTIIRSCLQDRKIILQDSQEEFEVSKNSIVPQGSVTGTLLRNILHDMVLNFNKYKGVDLIITVITKIALQIKQKKNKLDIALEKIGGRKKYKDIIIIIDGYKIRHQRQIKYLLV